MLGGEKHFCPRPVWRVPMLGFGNKAVFFNLSFPSKKQIKFCSSLLIAQSHRKSKKIFAERCWSSNAEIVTENLYEEFVVVLKDVTGPSVRTLHIYSSVTDHANGITLYQSSHDIYSQFSFEIRCEGDLGISTIFTRIVSILFCNYETFGFVDTRALQITNIIFCVKACLAFWFENEGLLSSEYLLLIGNILGLRCTRLMMEEIWFSTMLIVFIF